MIEWREYKLGEIAEVVPGYAFKGKDFTNNGVPIVKIGDINPPIVNLSECQKIAPEKVYGLGKFKLTKGDFVLAMTGATIGKVGRYVSEEIGYLNQRVAKFNERPGISDKRFLYHLITSHKVSSQIINRGLGSAQPNVSGKDIESILVDIPPLPTQKAIAEILSSLDDKIELNNQINQNLEALAQALFKQWFVDFEFPNENGEPYKSSGGEMVDSELGEIPKGWKVFRLKELLTIKRGGSPRPIQEYMADFGLPWVKISDATALNNPFLFETKEFIKPEGLKKTVLMKKGSLVLSNSATPGLPIFLEIDACIHDGWLHFQDIKKLSYNYLYLFFLEIRKDLVGKGNGSIFINLKTDILKEYEISIAPDEILSGFKNILDPIFENIKQVALENRNLIQLRDTLLPKLISGELEVNESLLEQTF